MSDRVAMIRYSVFSLEACATILWNDLSKQEASSNVYRFLIFSFKLKYQFYVKGMDS